MLAVGIPVPALWSLQKGSVCGSALWVHAWAHVWDSPRLRRASPHQPFPGSSQAGAGGVPEDGQPLSPQAAPSLAAAAQGTQRHGWVASAPMLLLQLQ